MTLRPTIRLAICALLFAALPAGAALYKWTDEKGGTVYGDTPPPGVKAERISANVAPGDPNAVREMASKDAQIKKLQEDRAADQAKAEKAATDAKAKLDRCVQLRGRLQTLKSNAPVYKYDENGGKVYYDAAERDQAVADTLKTMNDQDCPIASAG
jgi:erythromycin esterase-like protein